ncbi:hypothetical protein [Glaciimonas immobilis]|uniref:Uncharacterized protein n=1 Tax=Glaciimonas immobilis TaxID=728004 RepID=A0A840RYG5_9BURK|nr:hypothetical protein [Glaciimonas immobilis]MBB5202593.1 hypothetical protein [Glaciimonas immobilis]
MEPFLPDPFKPVQLGVHPRPDGAIILWHPDAASMKAASTPLDNIVMFVHFSGTVLIMESS